VDFSVYGESTFNPLEVQETGVEQRGDVTIHNISYASPKGGDPSQSG
jgi:hypothetical protein